MVDTKQPPSSFLHVARRGLLCTLSRIACIAALIPAAARAQVFVEYPSHPATYGDHTIAATWPGGPVGVSVEFESDESVLHGDGIGQSQRTARNTLTFTPPSAPTNPQDYDDTLLVARYSARLPLLQQMSSNGASVLRYVFTAPVTSGFDLFVTDMDTADSVSVWAFDPGGVPIDMRTWTIVLVGDLSLFKNTGTVFSSIVAPPPTTSVTNDAWVLVAADSTNYNRSYTVLRTPAGAPVARVEIRFRGLQNSASRAVAGTGAHTYVGLATPPPLTSAPMRPAVDLRLRAASPVRGSISWEFTLDAATPVNLALYDIGGRRLRRLTSGERAAGTHAGETPRGDLAPGLYWLRLEAGGAVQSRRLVLLD